MFFFKKVESKKGLEKSARQKDNNAEDWMMKLLETRADKLTMQHANATVAQITSRYTNINDINRFKIF